MITLHRESLVIRCSLVEKPFLTSLYKVALHIGFRIMFMMT